MKNETTKKIRYFSMFAGVGGFELGLQDFKLQRDRSNKQQGGGGKQNLLSRECKSSNQKFRCVGFSEIDKYASELLSQKFPKVKNYGDATKINPRELPEFDMLCGGFPCQAFSIAGKRRGFQDTRGTLFFDIARILEVKRPQIVLLENVKGLLNHNKGETFRKIIQTLSELGYNVQWMVLNSKFFGVAQNRERVFIIGNLRGTSRAEILPFRESNEINNQKQQEQTARTLTSRYHKQGQWEQYIMDLYNNKIHSDGMKIRRLTPTECERLQGFPDGWTEGFSDTQRYKMMGNAVTTNVIKALGEKLK